MKIDIKKYALVLIAILFFTTRLYKINEVPPSVYWDEASIGYNAYSIAQTGRDEWGKFLPIHFRAFGEFKLPVYIYASAIFVKIFGLNEFSVRIPAVFFSFGVVILTYLLAKKLSGNENIGLLSSFFITISPWLFIFSRTGYEATAGLMFYLLALYLFLSIQKNQWYIFLSMVSFVLSVYSYNSFRLINPLTILILLTLEYKTFIAMFRSAIIPIIFSLLLALLSLIPVYRLYVYDTGISRLQAVSGKGSTLLTNYLSHFDPRFLFISGDRNLRSQQFGFGELYLPQLLLLPLGFIYIISRKPKYGALLLFLTFLAPIPAAITKESPHSLRAISLAPFLAIISSMGILYIKKYFSKKYLLEVGFLIILFIFFLNYFINFMKVYSFQSSEDWQYGYKKIFLDFKNDFGRYDRIIISDEYAQPYIFGLFYLKYAPEKFISEVKRNDVSNWGFSTVSKFGKFEFGKVNKLLKNKETKNTLIFASVKEFISNQKPVSEIKFLDGTTAFLVYKL